MTTPQMTVLQQYIHSSRYARWVPSKGRRETWDETVDRYVDFFEEHIEENTKGSIKDIKNSLRDSIFNMEVMPSMRALMTAGPALARENIAGYNCSFVAVDSPRAFDEALYILMNGTGVGFSVETHHINKLPLVAEEFHQTDTTVVVADSKLGWAKALKELVAMLYAGQVPNIDVSNIRPAGSTLKVFGGRASGPDPLVDTFDAFINTFRGASGRRLNSLECHDLMCYVASCVVVGGVRRAALISLSDLTDERMRHAKTGQWYTTEQHRSFSNNSAVYNEKPDVGIFMSEWLSLYNSKSGERGIINREGLKKKVAENGRRDPDYDFGVNPCCLSGDTQIHTLNGVESIRTVCEKVENGEPVLVQMYDHKLDSVVYGPVEAANLTRPDAELIELEVVDDESNVHTLKLTPDHLVFTENRGYVRADELSEEDILVVSV